MKKLIVVIALLTSFSSIAAQQWSINSNGVAVSPVSGDNFAFMTPGGWLGFSFGTDCLEYKFEAQVQAFVVDGVAVRMESECNSGSRSVAWTPITLEGNAHILQVLSNSKSTIKVDGKPISSVGFQKALGIIRAKGGKAL